MSEEKKTVALNFAANAKPYRSVFRVKAMEVQVELEDKDVLAIPVGNGRTQPARKGDFIVQLDDGRLEVWTGDRFSREFELEVPAGQAIGVTL